jgi:hypothetical protein
MLEERDEGFSSNKEMVEQPKEREEGPTSIDVTDKQISIEEVPVAVPQEESLQEQVQIQQEPKIRKRKQERNNFLFIKYFKAGREKRKSD